MKRAVVFLLLLGCYTRIDLASVDAPARADVPRTDVPVHDGEPARAVCGGELCYPGQICCLVDGRCIDPGDPTCAVPPGAPSGACASNDDCRPGTYCQPTHLACAGPGLCVVGETECFWYGAEVCGCDGRTYRNGCFAAAAGVPIVARVPCGEPLLADFTQLCPPGGDDLLQCGPNSHCDAVTGQCVYDGAFIVCGGDSSHCPPGLRCCPISGVCHDPIVAGTCAVPPDGTVFPCAADSDCHRFDGSWWPHGAGLPVGAGPTFCDGPRCGGPGGCRLAETSCTGTLAPVCGCDGRSYTNECEAHRARVRVAHEGACP